MVDAAAIVDALEHAGYRRTAPRRALAELVAARNGHFTADGLLAESRRRRLGVTRATVFRSLDVLADLRLVERLDLPTGGHAFVACEPVHHHHVVCSSCGRSTPVEDTGLERLAELIGRSTGYRVETHRLELFGLCPSCQATQADRTAEGDAPAGGRQP
jgi:Fur family ferric uptake transcriptional regulator